MIEKIEEFFEGIEGEPRLLMEVELKPLQGERFQPTGFPDLGPAEYLSPDGRAMLLVESTQSMANRLENVCWDYEAEDLVEPLRGLPYIHVDLGDGSYTNSILEAHRINSEYIMRKMEEKKLVDSDFKKIIESELNIAKDKPINYKNVYRTLLKYDVNSLIHGTFLEEIDGRIRVPRMLSSFIEAYDVNPVMSGGVKFSRVSPKEERGVGHVPYSRTEYTAKTIKAFFNIDLAGIRGFGLGEDVEKLLVLLSLYKIRKFLREGLRLRTACDLKTVGDLKLTYPQKDGLEIPALETLEKVIPDFIKKCREKGYFAEPPITKIRFKD